MGKKLLLGLSLALTTSLLLGCRSGRGGAAEIEPLAIDRAEQEFYRPMLPPYKPWWDGRVMPMP